MRKNFLKQLDITWVKYTIPIRCSSGLEKNLVLKQKLGSRKYTERIVKTK